MSEGIDATQSDAADTKALRSSLERMREQAARELDRLNRRLAKREYEFENTVASATERLALQQELTMLQQALGTKEQALDRITEECKRLEDQLEDRNLAFDGLKQEFERKNISLQQAQEQVERLQEALSDLQNTRENELTHQRPIEPMPFPEEHPRSSRSGALWFVFGFLILAAGGVGVWAYFNTSLFNGGSSPIRIPLVDQPRQPPVKPPVDTRPAVPDKPAQPPVAGVEPSPRPEQPGTVDTPVTPPPVQMPPKYRDRLPNGTQGPTLAVLPAGTYVMGMNDLAARDFVPAHKVSMPAFMIGVYEVTFDEYDQFARATGHSLPNDFGWGRGRRPVVDVSWEDAEAYVDWLSSQTGKNYRLPSEAEWEYAARAGVDDPYWWGFRKGENHAVCFDCGSMWDRRSTAPVGSFEPNPLGLYDTAGNAMEWVQDCYTSGYDGAPADGSARLDGDCAYRVARGGAFNKPASSMRVFMRSHLKLDTRLNMMGFRVARDQ